MAQPHMSQSRGIRNRKETNMATKALLFDSDGVVLDSAEHHFQAWKLALEEWGGKLTSPHMAYLTEGQNTMENLNFMMVEAGCHVPYTQRAKFVSRRLAIFNKMPKPKLYPDAHIISHLRAKGYKTALVTSSEKSIVTRIMGTKKMQDLFDVVLTGDSVNRRKPFPDIYLKAASMLSVKSRECIGIENAPLGVAAVKDAGMFCIAITNTLDKKYLKQADVVVDSLIEIGDYLDDEPRGTFVDARELH